MARLPANRLCNSSIKQLITRYLPAELHHGTAEESLDLHVKTLPSPEVCAIAPGLINTWHDANHAAAFGVAHGAA